MPPMGKKLWGHFREAGIWLGQIGIDPQNTNSYHRSVRNSNWIAGILAVISLFYIALAAYLQITQALVLGSICGLGYLLCIALNWRGFHYSSKVFLVCSGIFSVVIGNYLVPVSDHVLLLLFPVAFGTFVVFDDSETGSRIFFSVLTILMIVLSHLLVTYDYPQDQFKPFFFLHIVVSFVLSYGLVLYYVSSALLTRRELEGALRDLSESQEQLRIKSRLSAIGEISGVIAHEVNNPLAVVLAHAETGMEKARDPINNQEVVQKSFEAILTGAKRISGLISSLRSTLVSQGLEREGVVPLVELVENTLKLYSPIFEKKGVRVESDLVPANVKCRAGELQQVWMNLIQNSLDAIARQPDPFIRIRSQLDGERVRVYITDSGPGISPQVAVALGSPFFSTKGPGIGTGIGLNISKRIIESCGGELRYEPSEPHTTFMIELPLASSPPSVGADRTEASIRN